MGGVSPSSQHFQPNLVITTSTGGALAILVCHLSCDQSGAWWSLVVPDTTKSCKLQIYFQNLTKFYWTTILVHNSNTHISKYGIVIFIVAGLNYNFEFWRAPRLVGKGTSGHYTCITMLWYLWGYQVKGHKGDGLNGLDVIRALFSGHIFYISTAASHMTLYFHFLLVYLQVFCYQSCQTQSPQRQRWHEVLYLHGEGTAAAQDEDYWTHRWGQTGLLLAKLILSGIRK